MKAIKVLLCLLLCTGMPSLAAPGAPAEQMVDPSLLAIHEHYQPELVKVGGNVHAAFAFDYSNFAFIEGDDGIILVDAGWFPGPASRALEALRKRTSKPIVAIIYTHLHLDHYGGAATIMAGEDSDIPVYGPAGWREWVEESFSSLRPAMFKRIFMQMGMVLPYGEEGTVGNGIGPSPRFEGPTSFDFPPTVDIAEATTLNIAGVEIELLPVVGDLNETLWVWLPKEQVLFTGDAPPHGTFPAIETARFEIGRDPARLIESMDLALAIDPEVIVPGHGRLFVGRDDVRDVVNANRDITSFIVDQVDRYYLKGYSADRMLDEIELPPALAEHPDLQAHYHRWEWMFRQRFIKRSGFIQESMDYLSLTKYEEARRLLPLLGGAAAVRAQAQTALEADDARWAARLASYALKVDPADSEARAIRQAAFLRVARTTVSGNERNYLLSIIRQENGELDWTALFANANYEVAASRSAEELLAQLKVRFRAEDAGASAFTVAIDIPGEPTRYLQVRNRVLYLLDDYSNPEASMVLERDTLNKLAARLLDFPAALESGEVEITAGEATARRLLRLIE
jgi:alkyl sulfatase BDS1-like metallo-beta-lactamase superfamily hydrolase